MNTQQFLYIGVVFCDTLENVRVVIILALYIIWVPICGVFCRPVNAVILGTYICSILCIPRMTFSSQQVLNKLIKIKEVRAINPSYDIKGIGYSNVLII